MIKWYSKKDKGGTATIYSTNITISKFVYHELLDSYAAMLGIDDEKKEVLIKPISKDEYDQGLFEKESLFILSGGKTYTRISSTDFVSMIGELIGYNYKLGAKKYECYYNGDDLVIIDLNKEVTNDK